MLPVLPLTLLWLAAFASQDPNALSEEEARQDFREAAIAGCEEVSLEASPELEGFNWPRLCRCATDLIIEGKSAQSLREMVPNGPGQSEAVAQCLAEMAQDGDLPWSGKSR